MKGEMLQIHLNKGGSGSDGSAGGGTRPSGLEHVTVSCPEHLVLADLLVAKGVGLIPAASAKTSRTIGRKRRRSPGEKVHICLCCDFPISIYGRLSPCEHAFCLTCARSEPTCYLCDQRIQKIQTIKMLDGIFICGAPHCLRSFLKKYDFEQHLRESHLDLLQPPTEKQEGQQKDNLSSVPSVSDSQHKSQTHTESQALSRSVSAPVIQPSQQVPQSVDSSTVRAQPRRGSMSAVTSPPEKPVVGNQLVGVQVSSSASFPEKQSQPNQSANSSSAGNCPEQPVDKKHPDNMQCAESQPCVASNKPQMSHATTQSFEKQSNQSHNYYQNHQSNSEMHQSAQGQNFSQQPEKRQVDAFSTQAQSFQPAPPGRSPQMQVPQPAMPPQYGSHPYPLSYPMSRDAKQQHVAPQFDPRYGPMNNPTVHSPIQNIQDNNHRFPMPTPFVPQIHDSQQIGQAGGNSVMPNAGGTSAIQVPKEGYLYADRQNRFSNNQTDFGQVPTGLPAQLPHHGIGMPFDQSSQYQETHNSDLPPPPLPKHRNYPNLASRANPTPNHGWNGGRMNTGSHGYGSWMVPPGN